ncbi:hypothetical protein A1D31_30095 [Bradyrhizobium liaoningense]|nr:hypothetical protein A1D31_30095 [Bradyrhizobium liaoningense]
MLAALGSDPFHHPEFNVMDWMLTALILTTAQNYAQSHIVHAILLPSEKACNMAGEDMKAKLGGLAANGFTVEVRYSCAQRKGEAK